MPDPVGLSVGQLFRKVFDALQQRLEGETVVFERPPRAEIADDSDWHRSRTGYMVYEAAFLATIGNDLWLFAFGNQTAGYPADPYAAELLGRKVRADENESPEERQQRLSETIGEASYFSNTFFVGMADGRIAGTNYRYSQSSLEHLGLLSEDDIVQDLEHRTDVLHADLRPVVSQARRYNEALAQRIVEAILASIRPQEHVPAA